MPKKQIPRVPIQTPMFEIGPDGKPRLTRTWIIFFQRREEAGKLCIGWDIQDSTPGTDVSDPVIPFDAMTIGTCRVRIKFYDDANPLEFDILNNGTSIFETLPLIPAGTSTREAQEFTAFAADQLEIAVDDDVTLNIVQGGDWEVAIYLVSA